MKAKSEFRKTRAFADKAGNTITKKAHREEIFEYIRRRHHGRTLKAGVILGVKDGKVVKIGWSKCNLKLDGFDKRVGLRLAMNRALAGRVPKSEKVSTPKCIRRQVRQFRSRCKRYFKDAKKVVMPA